MMTYGEYDESKKYQNLFHLGECFPNSMPTLWFTCESELGYEAQTVCAAALHASAIVMYTARETSFNTQQPRGWEAKLHE